MRICSVTGGPYDPPHRWVDVTGLTNDELATHIRMRATSWVFQPLSKWDYLAGTLGIVLGIILGLW